MKNNMKRFFATAGFLFVTLFASAQSIDQIINVQQVERIEKILSSDAMEGRKTFTPSIDRAADFICEEFKKNNLQYFPGLTGYRQEFRMVKVKPLSSIATFDGQVIDQKNIADAIA